MLRVLSSPMKNGMPADRICEKLKKTDAQICELRYQKEIDVETMDLKQSRVKVRLRALVLFFSSAAPGPEAFPFYLLLR